LITNFFNEKILSLDFSKHDLELVVWDDDFISVRVNDILYRGRGQIGGKRSRFSKVNEPSKSIKVSEVLTFKQFASNISSSPPKLLPKEHKADEF